MTNFNIDGFDIRHGTAAEWAASSRILRAGELGATSDTNELRLGDGVSLWADLKPFVTSNIVNILVAQAIANTPSIGQADLDQVADMVLAEIELPDLVLLWENAKA